MSDESQVLVDTKHWWESWTVWTNVLSVALLILALPEFISILPVTAIPYITLIAAVINMILRFRTTEPIGPTANSLRKS